MLGRGSKCGSIALTAMQTGVFGRRTCSAGRRREAVATEIARGHFLIPA